MDVGRWLRGLGLGQYEEKFRDNRIDADLLPRLTVDDLKDIGVSIVGDRRRLLDAIAALADVKPPAGVPASSSTPSPRKGPEVSAERRPITVMFCDLVGSTGLAAKLDPEAGRVEAGVARRGLALACYLAGDFLEAQIHCERALEVCDLQDDRERQERFQDATGPIVCPSSP